jgi:uncharacterized protein (TIGR03083 family)
MDLVVPTCPEWNVEQLVRHLGAHHRWVTASIEAEDPSTETADIVEPDLRGDELLDWLREGVEELALLIDTVPDDRPAWSWAGDNRKGFWSRRTTVETTIHRWDLENAVGARGPLDPALAADGVDEMAVVIVAGVNEGAYTGATGIVQLEATDTGDFWSLNRGAERTVVTRGTESAPDLRVAGTAEGLLLCIWGRGTAGLDIDESSPAAADLLAWLTA